MNYDDIKEKLKPCPFCGGPLPRLVVKRKGSQRDLTIKCRNCDAKSGTVIAPGCGNLGEELLDLVAYWNRRAYEGVSK